ncbi:MAG: class I SAM-dependent methyltransferase [Cyanobacteriota bacterium]|jgi:SAM-dependent methyltransferase
MTSMSENNTVYYKGSYWNDYAPVREYINKSVSGRGDMDWSQHFASLTKKSFQKALILNCGNGWVERDLYKQGLFQSAIGVDSSPELLHEAQSAARAHGLPLDYVQLDTNMGLFPEHRFDLIVNHAAAHHVTTIDKVFRALANLLSEDGFFVSFDYVGPHRNQYSVEAWSRLWELNQSLPEVVRHPRLCYPHYPTMLVTDPSEAVHSELIDQMFNRYFHCLEWRGIGGAIAYPLLTHNTALASAPKDESDFYIRKILAEDDRFRKEFPASSLFAFFYGKPNKAILASPERLQAFSTEEEEREWLAERNGYRYYQPNVLQFLYEQLECQRCTIAKLEA